ncbi:MAG: tetratricopeptide repeat protein [Treponema sp.]|jgi:tetratricopeptide (TPR) repeat protein|nr:tetratricopeptide repeat protein [Treponema sp.]
MSVIEMQKIAKLIKDGDYENAEELLKGILEESPHNRTARFLFGITLARTGMLEEAEAEFLNLLEKDPRDVEALGVLAIVYRWRGKFKDALGVFNEAIELDPTRVEFYRYIADIQILEKNLKAAFMAYAKVIECNPEMASAYNNLGIVYFEMNDIDKALAAFQQAISRDGGNAKFYYNYAIALEANNQLQEAVREYEIAVGIDPYWTAARLNLGSALAKLKQLDKAGGTFDVILDEDPLSAEAWNNMGAVLAMQGYKEEAIRHFARALEECSRYDLAQRNMDSIKHDAEPKFAFAVADMLLDEEMSILFNLPKPEFEPLSGDFMGFEIPHLFEFMKYLKKMVDFLPKERRAMFDQSVIRVNMEHIINTFMGRRGILREIQDLRLKQQTLIDPIKEQIRKISSGQESAMDDPSGLPEGGTGEERRGALDMEELVDFLAYLETLSSSLPEPAVMDRFIQKMKTAVSVPG